MSGDDPIIDLEDLLNPDEQHQFRQLCIETSAEDLAQLTSVVDLHLEQIRDYDGPNADVETAEAIGSSLTSLLTDDTTFDDEQRSLIRGAVEYFLLADDASGDLDDVFGFDDDARVLNSVLERIGKTEYRVELT